LFALDAKFGIESGFRYVPDCRDIDRQSASGAYCGSSFGEDGGGYGGDADGFGGSESNGSDGGGGDSGGGDGGGCGGGGD
jgi:hypothetical protein